MRRDQARGEAPAQWRRVRRLLNEHRMALAATAAALYPDLPRVAGTDLLCWPGWLPATPLDLADVPLGWVQRPAAARRRRGPARPRRTCCRGR